MTFDLILTTFITFLLFIWLGERVLYIVFIWAYVQNFVLAWMYTSRWAGKDLCQALLVSKEFLLLWLFLYFLPRISRYSGGRWPVPLRVLGYFTVWCVLRYAAGVVFQGERLFGNLWSLRTTCFPFEMLTVGLGVTLAEPRFANRFIRHALFIVSGVAAVGILLYLIPTAGFWRDHVDIASYNSDVKAESPASILPEDVQAAEEGVTGNGMARVAFTTLSLFRAFGTVGDAVGFGHLVAFPVLLLALWLRRNWKTQVMLVLTAVALFLSFTRSAWIFVAVAFLYVLICRRKYRIVFGFAATSIVALSIWAPLATLYSETLEGISSDSADIHAQGASWIYTQGLWQLKNVVGQGMSADLMESGYGILLVWYGLPAIVMLVWFLLALYLTLRGSRVWQEPLSLVAQAVPLALLVILNFSYYSFSFIPYLFVWFVVGACLAQSMTIQSAANSG